jgi:hypothetical protein
MDASYTALAELLPRRRSELKHVWLELRQGGLELWALRRGGGEERLLVERDAPGLVEAWRAVLREHDFRARVWCDHAPRDLGEHPEWHRIARKLCRGGYVPFVEFIPARAPSAVRRAFRWSMAPTIALGFELARPPWSRGIGQALVAVAIAQVAFAGVSRRVERWLFGTEVVDGVYLLPTGVVRIERGVVRQHVPTSHVIDASFAVRGSFMREPGPPFIEYREGIRAERLELAQRDPGRWSQIDLALARWQRRLHAAGAGVPQGWV